MNLSFAIRLGLAIFAVGGTLTLSVSLIIYNQISGNIWNGMSSRLKDLNRLALSQIKPDHIKTIINLKNIIDNEYPPKQEQIDSLSEGSSLSILPDEKINEIQGTQDFQELIQYMRRVKFSTAQSVVPKEFLPQIPIDELDVPLVRFVYILSEIPSTNNHKHVRFLADGDYESIDINKNGVIDDEEQATSIGQLYDTSGQPGIENAFKGTVSSNPDYTIDQWGIWITSYGPIFDVDGKIIAVLGIDMNAVGEFNLLRKLRIVIITVIVLSVVLSLLAGYGISRFFNKPIAALIEGANAVSKEDYTHQVKVKSKDELGVLANTFNTMVTSVKEMKNRLQDYAETLEEKVEARTKELQQSLAEVNELKNQQDADYFLTSLLLTPLSKNSVSSDTIEIEFFIKQKKEFSFRGKILNIGGDINIAHSIIVENKKYIVFLNGDAMGKSIQGAGGALVLGAVFHSIIERVKLSPAEQIKSPERWLKDAFVEMHKVFEAFDGSMLMSCVLGLINEKSGTLYFVNAEHPNIVLYRDNVASFVDPSVSLRKLGTEGIDGQVSIKVYNLVKDDILIIGSDGKDDLLLESHSNSRVINEDESVILSVVQKSKANVPEIIDRLKNIGGIIDDLSLLKVTFKGEIIHQHELNVIKESALQKFRNREYSNAVNDFIKLFEHDPTDFELMYYGSYSAKMARKLSISIEWGERVYLRKPDNIDNLVNLINSLLIQNNLSRASRLLRKLEKLNPEKEKIIKLKEILQRKENKLKSLI